MNRYLKIYFICMLCFIFSAPAWSELYQYKDKNGITRITNDIYSVPVEERSQLEKYSEIENIPKEMEIQPLKNKTLAQPITDKTISPKTLKTTTADKSKTVTPPKTPPKTTAIPKKAATEQKTVKIPEKHPKSPAKPIVADKVVQKPNPVKTGSISYKSKKIIIVKPAPEKKSGNNLSTKQLTKKHIPEKTIQENNNHSKPLPPQTEKQAVVTPVKKAIPLNQPQTVSPTVKAVKKPETKTAVVQPEKTVKEAQITPSPKTPVTSEIKAEKTQAQKQAKPDSVEKTVTSQIPEAESQPEPSKNKPEKQVAENKKSASKIIAVKPAPEKPGSDLQVASAPQQKTVTTAVNEQTDKPAAITVKNQASRSTTSVLPTPAAPKPAMKASPKPDATPLAPTGQALKPDTRNTAIALSPKKETKKNVAGTKETENATRQAAPILPAEQPKPETSLKMAKAETGNTMPALPDQNVLKSPSPVKTPAESGVTPPAAENNDNLLMANLETTRVQLMRKKEALNKKFLSLMKEKEGIENNVDENDEKSVLAYNENVKKLNIKIKQYKKEKKELQAEIKNYNNAIRQSRSN